MFPNQQSKRAWSQVQRAPARVHAQRVTDVQELNGLWPRIAGKNDVCPGNERIRLSHLAQLLAQCLVNGGNHDLDYSVFQEMLVSLGRQEFVKNYDFGLSEDHQDLMRHISAFIEARFGFRLSPNANSEFPSPVAIFALPPRPQLSTVVQNIPHWWRPSACAALLFDCLQWPSYQHGCFRLAGKELPGSFLQRQFEVSVLRQLGHQVAQMYDPTHTSVSYHDFRVVVLEVFAALPMQMVSEHGVPVGPTMLEVLIVLARLGNGEIPDVLTRSMRRCAVCNNFPGALCCELSGDYFRTVILQGHYRAVMQHRRIIPVPFADELLLETFRIHERIIHRLSLLSEIVMMYLHDHRMGAFCDPSVTLTRYSLLLVVLDVDIYHSHANSHVYFEQPLSALIMEVYCRLDRVRRLLEQHVSDTNADALLLQLVFIEEQEWQLIRQQEQFVNQQLQHQRQQLQQQLDILRLQQQQLLQQLQPQQQGVCAVLRGFEQQANPQGVADQGAADQEMIVEEWVGLDSDIDFDRLRCEPGWEAANAMESTIEEQMEQVEELNRLHLQNLQNFQNLQIQQNNQPNDQLGAAVDPDLNEYFGMGDADVSDLERDMEGDFN